jgi:hypothetical protein
MPPYTPPAIKHTTRTRWIVNIPYLVAMTAVVVVVECVCVCVCELESLGTTAEYIPHNVYYTHKYTSVLSDKGAVMHIQWHTKDTFNPIEELAIRARARHGCGAERFGV